MISLVVQEKEVDIPVIALVTNPVISPKLQADTSHIFRPPKAGKAVLEYCFRARILTMLESVVFCFSLSGNVVHSVSYILSVVDVPAVT
mmetsp:Transcript_32667/g.41908  ORF Transcript_32667/g.41908 Transcript_32667/m.41908 type:complete len:89 (-) Transcript_32667:214-480(-)